MNKPATLSPEAIAALGADFPQLSFALNNPGAPNTVYTGANPKTNAGLQFQITTSTDTTLTPGAPVRIDRAPDVSYSLLYLDLTPFNLSDAEFTNIAVGNGSGWASLPDLASRTICLAPQDKSIPIPAGTDGVSLALTGFAVANPPSGSAVQLSVTYYNVDGITIDNFPSVTPLGVALLPPPDQHDNNLHDDISLTVEPTLVVCSKNPYTPVANTLSIQFSPGSQGRPVTAGKETVFEVHFLYAETPGSGALCTPAQGANFHPARGNNAEQWDRPAVIGTQEPYVSLKPPAGAAIVGTGVEAVVTFDIGNIVTHLLPGATLMLVTYSGIPNYQDGSFQVVLTKVPHVDIVKLDVTPNPAQLEKESGVAVVIDWVVSDGGKLKLTSSAGLDQDVTGTLSFPTTVKQTTDFHLDADGTYGANLDNSATKSTTAVVTPHIEFSATILPDNGGVKLDWNILGAFYAQLDGSSDLLAPRSHTTIPVGSSSSPPYGFSLKALDADRNEIGRATLKRCWTPGGSVPVGVNAMWTGLYSTGIAVSPDGKQLYAPAGDRNNSWISVFDAASLTPIGRTQALFTRVVAFAFKPDSSQIYVVDESNTQFGATLRVIDAKSYAVSATIRLSDLASNFQAPSALAANDKYIFVKTRYGPISLLILDAQTHAKAWVEPAPSSSGPISTGMALTRKRLYYTGDNVVKMLDPQTLNILNTANAAIPVPGHDQLVAAPDDSRTFLAQWNQVSTFEGSDWLNPTRLPDWAGSTGCQGIAVTSDCLQAFLLCLGPVAESHVQMEEFDVSAGAYVPGAALLQGAGLPVNIAISPDNTRVFVGLVNAGYGAGSITVLVANYQRSDS
jgi:DNA-binding beta-propeller fold protein YncE